MFFLVLIGSSACTEDTDMHEGPEYSVTIMQPNTDDKNVGDVMHIHVNFDEEQGETVHHINVIIKSAVDGTVVYSAPSEAHIHEETGHYEHHDDFTLAVEAGMEWILEAKVWGHEAGIGEKVATRNFLVN